MSESTPPAGRRAPTDEKRLLGRFLTVGNPFHHPVFRAWWEELPEDPRIVEPFAGADGLRALLAQAGLVGSFTSFDIEPLAPSVVRRDTLADFPSGFDAVVTNPPFLARHFARRKGLAVDHLPWGPHNNMYKVALDRCLAHAPFVAAIVPESFVTSGAFRDRLSHVVSLTVRMFDDTETPTCLALWRPDASEDFEVWRGPVRLGRFGDLASALPESGFADQIVFNERLGNVGLVATDSTSGPSIRFVRAADVAEECVKPSSRLVTRVLVSGLGEAEVELFLGVANARLAEYRLVTQDVLLTAFKGLRSDGCFRRRIDFGTARRVLAHSFADLRMDPVGADLKAMGCISTASQDQIAADVRSRD